MSAGLPVDAAAGADLAAGLSRAAATDRPVVHLYTVCWDEADMLGFFFRHYDPWVSRYVIYDDGSTDGSREILACHPRVEMRSFDRTDPESFVLSHRTMQDHAWKESRGKADWVVITAIDEHLHVPGCAMADYLAEQARAGVTMIPAMGFDMNASALPPDRGLLADVVTRGRARIGFNKLSLFRPGALAETGFGPGRHAAEPTGSLILPEQDRLMLWHYKHLGFARNAAREAAQALRLGRRDVAEGYGQHYLWSRARLRAFWDEMEAQSQDLAAADFRPAEACAGPLWWRAPAAARAKGPKVSVLIKAYNHAAYVAQCVRSVLDQSLTDFEIVATDDASTDETLSILRGFDDSRLNVRAMDTNRGIPAAMNATVARARGEYLAILNSDDYALPDRLAQQAAFLDAHPEIDAVFGMPQTVDERGQAIAPFNDFAAALRLDDFSRRSWLRQFFFHGNCLCSPTAMIRRSAYERAGPYDLRLASLQDLDMWIRMLVAGCRFHVLPEIVTAFRVRDGAANASAVTQTSILRTEFELTQILERYAAFDQRLFDEVFGTAEPASLPPDAPLSARLGTLALTVERPSYRSFALRCLHAAAARPEDIAQLWTLTASIDLFGECTLAERDVRIARNEAALIDKQAQIADRDVALREREIQIKALEQVVFPSTEIELAAEAEEVQSDSLDEPTVASVPPPTIEPEAPPSAPERAPRVRATMIRLADGPVAAIAWGRRAVRQASGLQNRHARALVSRILDVRWYRTHHPDLRQIDDPIGHYLSLGDAERRQPHPLFDPDWYIGNGGTDGLNALVHFLEEGDAAGRSPHPLFDVTWYRAQNPDVAAKGYNTLLHYITHGAREGRAPHPLFDVSWYLTHNRGKGFENPLIHYLSGLGTHPHPLFDDAFYRTAIPDLDALGWAPLAHYVARGAAAGFDPNPCFASAWYVANHETLGQTGENPLVHYVREGAGQGYRPHPDVDIAWYRARNPDVAHRRMDPLAHLLHVGLPEGRAARQTDAGSDDCPVLSIPYEVRSVPAPIAGRDVCVFVTYSPDGWIAGPTRAYLAALRQAGVGIILVIATDGLDRPLETLEPLVEGLIVRTNHGYDFAAWAAALTVFPDLWQARRLILANDSLLGPTDPATFATLMARIRRDESHVIALTDSHQVCHHLMSYFTVMQGAALTASVMRETWNRVRSLADKQAVIAAYELVPVSRLAEAGLTHTVLFPSRPLVGRACNPTLDEWRRLVAEGFPFLKAQLVRDRLPQCDPAGWRDALATNPILLQAIEAELRQYPTRAATKHRPVPAPRRRFDRRPHLSTFYGAIQAARPTAATDLALEVPFQFQPETRDLPDRVAVIGHIFYPEMTAEIARWLANIPVPADLFISTDTEEKRATIGAALAGYRGGSVHIKIFPNVGRDLAPMLVAFADVFDQYEIFLHLHSKKSPHDGRFAPWRDYLMRTILGSPQIVASILTLLTGSKIGIVFPQHFEPVRSLLNWGGNYDVARDLMQRCGVALSKTLVLDFPSGSFYWGRSAALRPLLDLSLTSSDFPAETGQIDGTIAHAIERTILFACERAGFGWTKVERGDDPAPGPRVPVHSAYELADAIARVDRTLLHNRLIPFAEADLIPELVEIHTRPDRAHRPRLNLVIPTLDPDLVYGGIATALRVFSAMADALGSDWDLRVLCQTRTLDLRAMAGLPGYVLIQPGTPDAFARTVVDLNEAEGGEISLRQHDVFLATAWWTAASAFRMQSVQRDRHGQGHPVIYLIQDHEPDFYGWSAQHAAARETYAHGGQTIAIINSEELASFMTRRYALPDATVLRFALNPAISRHLTRQPRQRIILIYGRPGTPRNAFPTLCAALSRWQQSNPMAARVWRIISVGEDYEPGKAGDLENFSVAGKLPLDAYANLLSHASVGISLMLSPHPSYPPLEMAAAGLVTVTNAYDAKNLARRSPDIISIPHATPDALTQAIEVAVAKAENKTVGRITNSKKLKDLYSPIAEFDAFALATRLKINVVNCVLAILCLSEIRNINFCCVCRAFLI